MMKVIREKLPEQVRRLSIVVAIIVVGIFLTISLLPRSFKDRSVHRQSTIEREMIKPIQFAGSSGCKDCHEDESTKKQKGYHRNLSCETCHGPLDKHTGDPVAVKPVVPRERKFCHGCHEYDPSRPTGFPQINPAIHNPLRPCITCHNPHNPEPPRPPQECSACHATIARTKAVSSHALLSCTTCHTVPRQHFKTPRSVKPTKPEAREFCGTCHGKASTVVAAPKVDLSTHGERYLCWQCHYPHLPKERL